VLGGLKLRLHGRLAGASVAHTPAIAIPFGKSRTARVQITPRVWQRHRHDRSLRLEISPVPEPTMIPSPAVSTGASPRTLTVRIAR
jgi:hypothetical protein